MESCRQQRYAQARRREGPLMLGLLTGLAALAAQPSPTSAEADTPEHAIRSFFRAAASDDDKAYARLTSGSFYAFDAARDLPAVRCSTRSRARTLQARSCNGISVRSTYISTVRRPGRRGKIMAQSTKWTHCSRCHGSNPPPSIARATAGRSISFTPTEPSRLRPPSQIALTAASGRKQT